MAIGTEQEEMEKARDAFQAAEKQLRKAERALSNIMAINTDHTRHEEANAAFCTRAMTLSALGAVELAHGKGTEYLFKFWPDEAVPHEHGGVLSAGHR